MRNAPAMLRAQFPMSRTEGAVTGMGEKLLAIPALQGQQVLTVMPVGVPGGGRHSFFFCSGIEFDIAGAQEQARQTRAVEITGRRNPEPGAFPEQQSRIVLMLQDGNLQGTHRTAQAGYGKAGRSSIEGFRTIPLFQAPIVQDANVPA